MTLRILDGYSVDSSPFVGRKTPTNTHESLSESATKLLREVNFKSFFDCCDSNTRAVEQPEKFESVNVVVSISNSISNITTEDLVYLRFLFQSGANYAEGIVQNASGLPGLNGSGNTAPSGLNRNTTDSKRVAELIASRYKKVGEAGATR
ncbi:MAG: hypothetical protein LBH05_09310 [Deferribacteraceae bacterium]|nr:hypothetical protein [Deferribacteraceae bacterium]